MTSIKTKEKMVEGIHSENSNMNDCPCKNCKRRDCPQNARNKDFKECLWLVFAFVVVIILVGLISHLVWNNCGSNSNGSNDKNNTVCVIPVSFPEQIELKHDTLVVKVLENKSTSHHTPRRVSPCGSGHCIINNVVVGKDTVIVNAVH